MEIIRTSEINESIQDKLVFALKKRESVAGILSNNEAVGDVLIPTSIKFENRDFIVTSILRYSFKNSKSIKSIQIALDSQLQVIEKDSFAYSSIESITIPSKVSELEEGWCSNTPKLTKVTIMPNNKFYMYLDNMMIIGKTNKESDDYNVIIFVRRDIKEVEIPSFVNRIASYAFADSLIESIYIPPNIR